jgi:hypothetical protein
VSPPSVFIADVPQDGKPYILGVKAGPAAVVECSQGYTVVVQLTFGNLADMQYYDQECEAHMALKKVAGPRQQGMLTVYFEAVVEL